MRKRSRVLSFRVAAPVCAGALVLCLTALWGVDRLFPPDLHRAKQFALFVEARNGALLDAHTSSDGMWRLPLTAAQTDPGYLTLLMETEDRRFDTHPGVDPGALGRALWQLLRQGHIVSGGSTLAMQTARLLTPHPHTVGGKLRDILRALQLEWHYGRKGVLDLYLVLTPQGRNIEGVRAASLFYFHHEPDHLTLHEAAFLVTLPRRPAAFRPDRHPQALLEASRATLRRAGQEAAALTEAHAPQMRNIPHEAPSFVAFLTQRRRTGVIKTTLDIRAQRAVRRILKGRESPLRGTFASVVVNHENQIIAWSGGGEHQCPGCALDNANALRSPGSALKPFVYGMAFEGGWLTPHTRIDDVRLSFGGYAPHDYDRRFRGTTTVAQALQLSLNVPAVQALARVGPAHFMDRLMAGGAHLRMVRGATPNLSVILGGVDMSLLDLTMLYTAFDHHGQVAPLVFEMGQPRGALGQLLTPRAARDVRDVLRGTPPPAGGYGWQHVAFKTGTSYGGRDGWAMASTPEWTIGVWAGRPDGTAVPGLTGRETAGPVLADIVAFLMPRKESTHGVTAFENQHRDSTVLSPALRKFVHTTAPQIITPQSHAVIESRAMDGSMSPIALEAAGGRPPYHWFVNGMPLRMSVGAALAWTPASPGFAHITLVDATGRYSSVDVQIQ